MDHARQQTSAVTLRRPVRASHLRRSGQGFGEERSPAAVRREMESVSEHDFGHIAIQSDSLAREARSCGDHDLEAAPTSDSTDELDQDGGGLGSPGTAVLPPIGPSPSPTPTPTQALPAPPLALLGATLPDHIRSAASPVSMAQDRIPPRVDTPVAVGVSGVHPPMLGMTISVEGAGGGNGALTIDGAPTVDLAADKTVNLRGADQTDPGKAGNLRLVAKQGAQLYARSTGFSVSAIPQNFSVTFNSQVNTPTMRGLAVNNHWESDSRTVADLDQAERSEQVEYGVATGIWAGVVGGNNSGYLPADSPPLVDNHGTPVVRFTGPGSRIAEQTFTFNDKRTGATNIPATRSGFRLTRTAVVNAAGMIEFTVDKRGADTTAHGYSSKAGAGSVTRTQVI